MTGGGRIGYFFDPALGVVFVIGCVALGVLFTDYVAPDKFIAAFGGAGFWASLFRVVTGDGGGEGIVSSGIVVVGPGGPAVAMLDVYSGAVAGVACVPVLVSGCLAFGVGGEGYAS